MFHRWLFGNTDFEIIDWIDYLIGPALWIKNELSNLFNCIYLNTSNMMISLLINSMYPFQSQNQFQTTKDKLLTFTTRLGWMLGLGLGWGLGLNVARYMHDIYQWWEKWTGQSETFSQADVLAFGRPNLRKPASSEIIVPVLILDVLWVPRHEVPAVIFGENKIQRQHEVHEKS